MTSLNLDLERWASSVVEDDYEKEIFSILSHAPALTRVILTGKRDSRRHSTTSFSKSVVVAETSFDLWEFYHFAVGWRLNLNQ